MLGRRLVSCGVVFFLLVLVVAVGEAQDSGVDLDRMSGVTYTDALHATVVGAGSRILQTADGGGTWTERFRASDSTRLVAVSFATSEVGVAVGTELVLLGPGHTVERGQLLRTTDGGVTWAKLAVPDGVRSLSSVAFADALQGVAVGAFAMLRTTDGGATWTPVPMAATERLSGVSFAGKHGFAVGDGVTLETTDSGARWKRKQERGCSLSSVQFVGEKLVLVVGPGILWMSLDGGKNWRTFTGYLNYLLEKAEAEGLASRASSSRILSFNDVAAPTSTNFAVVGSTGIILRTTDGGRIWSLVDTGMRSGFADVAFGDALNGIAVGPKTVVTKDGGKTWTNASGNTSRIAADALSGTWDVSITGLNSNDLMKCTLDGNTTMSLVQNDLAVSGVMDGWRFGCSGSYTLAGTTRERSLRANLRPAPFSGNTDRLRVARFTIESSDYTAVFDGDLTGPGKMSGQLRMTAVSTELGTVKLTASWSATRR